VRKLICAVLCQIKAAEIAYDKAPVYDRYTSTQPVGYDSIRKLLAESATDLANQVDRTAALNGGYSIAANNAVV
jgi:hypothetical protein